MKQTVNLNSGVKIEVDVKACPFCGTQPEIWHVGNNYTKSQNIEFKCPECRIKRVNGVIRQPIEWCLDKSVEQWNMRSPTPDSTQE